MEQVKSIYDVVIVGSGPAGLTAATYAGRDNLKTLVVGGRKWGGQLMLTSTVDNYPGFPEGILGPELMEKMKKQAEKFGAEIKLADVIKVDFSQRPFKVWIDEGEDFVSGRTVIVATGADTIWLGVPNEEKLIGHGVSSCAPCDAFFFRGKKVAVVGGGDSAMEETLTLAKFATEVTIIHRRESFKASQIMQDRVRALPNVKYCMNCAVIEILGEGKVSGVRLKDSMSGEEKEMALDGVFVAIGHSPNSGIFAGQLELDEKGYIRKMGTENGKASGTLGMATSVPGVFVAGDVHDHHYKQAVTAAGFGCMAFFEAKKFLEENKE